MPEYWLEIESGMEAGPYSPEELRQKLQRGECSPGQYVVEDETNARCCLSELPGMDIAPSAHVECFRLSLDYECGLNGREKNAVQAARCAQEGHERGDLNCTALLCGYYLAGRGVPRDLPRMLELALEMETHHFAPGLRFLAVAYAYGYGVPLDAQKAQEEARKAVDALSSPRVGLEEELRYDCLLEAHALISLDDYQAYEQPAREYARVSQRPTRYRSLLVALQAQLESSPSVREELRQVLDAASNAGDADIIRLKAALLANADNGLYDADEAESLRLLRQAGEQEQANALLALSELAESPGETAAYLNRFWDCCCHGESRLRRKDELPCSIRLNGNDVACVWRVYEESVALPLFNAESLDQLIVPLVPDIVLKNEDVAPLTDVRVRLCAQDIRRECLIHLDAPLNPGEEVDINPLEHGCKPESSLYVEVRSDERYADMLLPYSIGYKSFGVPVDSMPPLAFWWEKGFFGGIVLKVASTGGTVANVVVTKKGGKCAPFTLSKETQPVSVGWYEFSDSEGLKAGEAFIVSADGYGPILGCILTTRDDKGTAGWLKAAGGAAAFIGGVLLGS